MHRLVWPARRASGTEVLGGNAGNSHVFNHQVKCMVSTLLNHVNEASASRISEARAALWHL
jgi:hypothetical protein